MIELLLKSKNYRNYKLRNSFKGFGLSFVVYLIYFLGVLSLTYLVSKYFIGVLDFDFDSVAYLIIGVSLLMFTVEMYARYGTVLNMDVKNNKSNNIFDFFDDNSLSLMDNAYSISKKNSLKEINIIIFISILDRFEIGKVFSVRSGLLLSDLMKKEIIIRAKDNSLMTSDMVKKQNEKFLNDCKNRAIEFDHMKITFSDMIMSLYKNSKIFDHILNDMSIKEDDLKNILNWTKRNIDDSKKIYYWQKNYYPAGIGQDWASGYTPNLNMFSTDITEYLLDVRLEYQSKTREDIISNIEDNLSKSGRNNILLIGDPGVGKTTLVNSFAQKVVRGKSTQNLNYKHIVQLDVNRILAGVRSKSELEARFLAIFNEAVYAGNIILFIKNIGTMVGNYMGDMGTINAAEFLLPYLESGKINVIATISYDDFKNKLQANTSLESFFNRIQVKEMEKDEVLSSIEQAISFVEIKHGVVFKYQSVRELIELASRYIHDEPFPQKAIDLLSELGMKAEKEGKKIIEVKDVSDFVSHRIKMPVGEVKKEEKDKLLNLEKVLHERVIGQDEAIDAISNALRRARAGLAGKKRPIGSFLFIGPTGVGKTETARALAEAYYGSEKNMIRFDMSEFQEISTIDRLIGSKSGREFVPGRLTQGVKNNPYTLILFDEIEKAHPNILNLLLQVLDEGRLTDATGRTIDFTSTIIICTSNAGSEKIRQYLEEKISAEALGKVIVDNLLSEGLFRPEFINRFDKVVCYKPLTPNEIVQIVHLMIKSLYKDLEDKDIKLDITQGAVNKLAKEGFDPVFGARPLRRLIQEKVENLIAKKMISGDVKKGETLEITESDI